VLLLVLTGLDKSTRRPSTSSSEVKETITAHHAHLDTEDTQPLELHTKTQKSISIESSTGDHQYTHGPNGTEESPS